MDFITALFARDWAAVGGWSLFITLVIFIVIGAFREWWVPGPRFRREEAIKAKALDLALDLKTQNGQLIVTNQIVQHFFEETTPKRGDSATTLGPQGGDPS